MEVLKLVKPIGWLIIAAIIILFGLGLMISLNIFPAGSEYQIGLVMIFSIGILLILLFMVATGFQMLQLADSTQALGLPEGSVRALIALFLLVLFLVFGVFLFRVTSLTTAMMPALTSDQIVALAEDAVIATVEQSAGDEELYDVWIRVPVTEEGQRLAEQLVTTLGTLVVAVAGFYFGTRAVSTARQSVERSEPGGPIVEKLEINGGIPGSFRIFGQGLKQPFAVRLTQGETAVNAKEILSVDGEIVCTFDLDDKAGIWNLVVVAADGKVVELEHAWIIRPQIHDIEPGSVADDETDVELQVQGRGFQKGAAVYLTEGGEKINVDVIKDTVTATSIDCKIEFTPGQIKAGQKWNLVLTNPDGKSTMMPAALAILNMDLAPSDPAAKNNTQSADT